MRNSSTFIILFLALVLWGIPGGVRPAAAAEEHPPIPIHFTLKEGGYATLVIERPDGTRVRNLVSESEFPAGKNTIWWDGLDDLGRDPESAKHAVYHIPGKLVEPGKYVVRGLVRPQIDLIYEMSPYSSGKPAWKTADPASEWLTNHSAPSDVLFLPAGVAPVREGKPASQGGQIMIVSKVAEGGSGLAWVDLDGNKLWGQHWLGGVWTAGTHMARDRGDRPVEGVYAYVAATWHGDKYNDFQSELRLHKLVTAEFKGKAPRDKRFGTGEDLPVLTPTYKVPFPPGSPEAGSRDRKDSMAHIKGLAAHNGVVVCAFEKLNQLLLIDVRESKVLGTVEAPSPRGLAFDRQGRLLVLTEKRLVRYTLQTGSGQPALSQAEVLVAEGLEDPQYVILGPDDQAIYISDWGNSHQVKEYAADGQFRRGIGTPGPLSLGRYDPTHMNMPAGMTVDDRGRLWVAENSKTPKRVSVWSLTDGKFETAYYGPARYGGAGAIDPVDPSRYFYDDEGGGIEFKLDWETGKSEPVSVFYRTELDRTGFIGRYTGEAPSYPLHHGGRLYVTNAYNHHTAGRNSITLWRMDDDGVARCVASVGSTFDASNKLLPAFRSDEMKARMPAGIDPEKHRVLFAWSDLNGDGIPQPEEVQFRRADRTTVSPDRVRITGVSVQDDLSFALAAFGDVAIQLKPTRITEAGVPVYDLEAADVLFEGVQSPASSGGGQILIADDGWVVSTTPPKPLAREGMSGVKNGRPMWSYPSLWPGLHASHIAPLPTEPGQLVGTTRVIGNVIDAPEPSDAGQLWAINGNKGNLYVFTVDGLFVATLFRDSRQAGWDAPQAVRGMKVNHLSLKEEAFGPVWTRTRDGKVYLQAGFTCTILRVDGLDRVRRLPAMDLEVSAEQLSAARQWTIDHEAARQASIADGGELAVELRNTAPVMDGRLDDWANAQWVTIDERQTQVGDWGRRKTVTRAAMTVAGDRLYLAVDTDDRDLLRNSGQSLQNLFKTGGCIDLMIGTAPNADPQRKTAVEGDQRLLVTRVKDKTTAVLYAPVSPGTTTEPVQFASPLRTIAFDRVEDVSDRVELAFHSEPDLEKDKQGRVFRAMYEVSIPLEVLNLTPEAGLAIRGDIGVLRGNGHETFQRVYWRNKAAALVSDIPSEAELTPRLWGVLRFDSSK